MGSKENIFSYNANALIDSKLKFYYGIPHCHTEISTGRGSPLEALEYAAKKSIDFIILTDHNSSLKEPLKKENSKKTKWNYLRESLIKYNKKNKYPLAILGFETRSNPWGDLNIVNVSNYFTGVINDMRSVFLWMLNQPDGLIFINHPHSPISKLNYHPILNHFITSIEVANGSPPHKYIRHFKYYYKLLDDGWRLGAINGQDNHRMNFGDSENLTCVVCNDFSKKTIMDAFRNRRTYSTESKTLKTYFSINNHFMGEIISLDKIKELEFFIYAYDTKYTVNKIEILSNGGSVVKTLDKINLNKVKYLIKIPFDESLRWYVIKIYQDGGKIAMTSPIFIDDKK